MKKKTRMRLVKLLSNPMCRDTIHTKMQKLEKKLNLLASLYFGKEVTIMYVNGTPNKEE